MVQLQYLSYPIAPETPLYGGAQMVHIDPDKSLVRGDSCNTSILSLPNHCGTHIDFPRHFDDRGRSLSDYSCSEWFFARPWILDVEAQEDELIGVNPRVQDIPEGADFLIIRTGFGRYREKRKYWEHNPGLDPGLAALLRGKCPFLRAVGVDCISISAYQHREIGRTAHKEFLTNHGFLLVEDMDLRTLPGTCKRVWCFPLLLQNSDGAPATIIGEFEVTTPQGR